MMKNWKRQLTKTRYDLGILAFALTFGSAQANPMPSGHWEGAIILPGTKLQVAVDLKSPAKTDDNWSGTIDIPAQMLRGYALGDVKVAQTQVKFMMPNIPGDPVFDGRLTDDGKHLDGNFSQNGRTFHFALERAEAKQRSGETPSHGVPGTGVAGHWQGSLRPGTGPIELRLVLHVIDGGSGALQATLDSLDQGANGIPVSSIALTNNDVHLELTDIQASYQGKLSTDGSEIVGTWKQASLEAALVFKRLSAPPKLARPQEPRRPFPYDEEEVKFAGAAPGVTLAGTLTRPKGRGPFPA